MLTLLRVRDVLRATGWSRAALYEQISKRTFPPAVRIGKRAAAWPLHEVEAINSAKIGGASDEELSAIVSALVSARGAKRPDAPSSKPRQLTPSENLWALLQAIVAADLSGDGSRAKDRLMVYRMGKQFGERLRAEPESAGEIAEEVGGGLSAADVWLTADFAAALELPQAVIAASGPIRLSEETGIEPESLAAAITEKENASARRGRG